MLIKKNGQLSIFIIISVILVIVGAFLVFNSKFEFFQSYDTKLKNQISDVVKDCVYETATTGTFLLGFQGGYINIDETVKYNPEKYIDFGFKIPNWDSETDKVPSVDSMQGQLNDYVKENAYLCVKNNLDSLDTYFDIEYSEDLEVNTNINDENVGLEVYFPIKFNEKNSEEVLAISEFYVNLEDLRLGDLFNLAVEIYNLEEQSNFLEELVLEQIYSANDYSSRESMPTEGMTISCGYVPWTKDQLKQNLANLNNNNFKYLQFEGTYSKDYLFEVNNISQDLIKYYQSPIIGYSQELTNSKRSFKNYEVDVVMPSVEVTGNDGYVKRYPFREFDVTPSNGQLVKPMKLEVDVGVQMPISCIQIYHHLYTLDYDLIIKLTDRNDGGGNFFFQFPVRVNVEKNNPKVELSSPITLEKPTFNKENYCIDEQKQYPLQVYAIDDSNDEVLTDVNISYKCISVTCDMGETKRLSYNGIEYGSEYNAKYEGNFPFCKGGVLIAEKEGYHIGKTKNVDTDETTLEGNTKYYDVRVISKTSFKLDETNFLLIDKNTREGKRVLSEEDGFIYVVFENKEYDFESSVIWPNEIGYLDTLELLEKDVTYNVSVIYVDNDYNMLGMLEYENYEIKVNDLLSADDISFIIPMQSIGIDADNYEEFYNYMKFAASTDYNTADVGIKLS